MALMILTVCCEQIAPLCLLYLPRLATAGALEQPRLMAGIKISYFTKDTCTVASLTLVLCKGGERGYARHVALIWAGSHVAQGGEVVLRAVLAYVAV